MSNVVAFDTHKFFKKLEASGFERSNAEGLTEAIQDAITTADLATKHDLKNTENALKAEISEVRADVEKVHVGMAELEARIIKWNLAAIIAASGLALAIGQLLK
ncbi:MAG: CCDC90 family protein [Zoogloeaceae bacterium]|jgi:hypothetical protein|nr:CCDC90 family protein [Zoogloeaceae bacterium]